MGLLLNKDDDVKTFTKCAFFYRNIYDKSATSDGFSNFVQKRFTNGTFSPTNPTDCSPLDTNPDHSCSLQQENVFGVFEASSWEYSLFAPHDVAGLIRYSQMGIGKHSLNGSIISLGYVGTCCALSMLLTLAQTLMALNVVAMQAGYFYAGNEPSFQTPTIYHYANQPARSADRVREVVYQNFNTTPAGLPGNDENAAMATLLAFHLVGLYRR